MIAKTGGNMVLNVDPNESPDARPIVEACAAAGVYVVTQWNKPADLHPWDFDPNYVAHISFDGRPNGKAMAEALFEAMGGAGGIVALGGILSNVPAIERKAGLDEALAAQSRRRVARFPGRQLGRRTRPTTSTSAWVTRFGDEIKGIWAANDGMGIAALEVLRAEGMAGTGAGHRHRRHPARGRGGDRRRVRRHGRLGPVLAGQHGALDPYHAKVGEFDPAAEPKEHREFYGTGIVITKANAEQFYADNIKSTPELDYSDIWGRVSGQIQYQ